MKNYIKEIIGNLKDASEIYITGPAQTKLLLNQELSGKKYFADKVIAVENSDSMTERQICAKIRNFFAAIT